jgi:hypothetical protein
MSNFPLEKKSMEAISIKRERERELDLNPRTDTISSIDSHLSKEAESAT